MKLSLDEITDWKEFEDLVKHYFDEVKGQFHNQVVKVLIEPSSVGSDEGRDILVTFTISDSIVEFDRKWIIQCKFYKKAVSTAHIASINIPTLIVPTTTTVKAFMQSR